MANDLLTFLDEFKEELANQLDQDDKRWGDTWKHRPREGQEERIMERYQDYFNRYYSGEQEIPWMKIVGLAYIAWIRENHPEVLIEDDGGRGL